MSVVAYDSKDTKVFCEKKDIDIYDKEYINKKLKESEFSPTSSLKNAYLEGWK